MIFWAFVFIRVLMAFLSWGYFVPDETWQSVEVAHKLGTVHVFTVKSTGQILWSQNFFLFIGVFSKPSGKMIVVPNFRFLS